MVTNAKGKNMHIAPELGDSLYKITAYDAKSISVNSVAYDKPLLLMPNKLIYPWEVNEMSTLTLELLSPILMHKPQLILFGTGKHWQNLGPELYGAIQQMGIGVEVMQTISACRTFNLLQEEGRLVAAALWPPGT